MRVKNHLEVLKKLSVFVISAVRLSMIQSFYYTGVMCYLEY